MPLTDKQKKALREGLLAIGVISTALSVVSSAISLYLYIKENK